ncbi:hypothetical protein [Sphingomonas sp.]|uniref:hypothetical protein n=1 Tax=Sphingomonas sp. TaxID=28214 RepID=UPI002C9CA72D|nr:hypothetical protein [Sphingomonas sp.]HTG37867.1 hypothetical protein [Sphingomonas sp.]
MTVRKKTGTALLTLATVLALPTAATAQNALGANYNEHFEDVDYGELDRANAEWVRIFLPMPQVDRAGPAEHGAVKTILDADRRGYKTILSLKFPYNRVQFPDADGPEFDRQLARLDAVLPLVMGKVDMLVIGNEPFIESRQQDWTPNFNKFYEKLARRAIAHRAANCGANCKTRLYMGSFNRLWSPKWRTPTTERWMRFVKNTPEIEGVDIHPHVTTIEQTKVFLDYVIPRMRPDQKFIATEFSLIWWWKDHLKKPVPAAFATKYSIPANTRNWQVIKAALDQPFPKAKWDDFLALNPWFEDRKHYLANIMQMFRATGRLAVATYGFKQGRSMANNFGPESTPWLLNSVVAGRTIRKNADGSSQFNYAWIDDFKTLQAK